MAIVHPETARDSAELHETEPLIQMPRMDVAFHNGVELQNAESEQLSLQQTVRDQLFADVLSARV
jgi:hypothetical protein